MKRRLTRRALTKILLVAPAALAGGPLACQTTSGGRPTRRLTAAQQKERDALSREVSRLQKSVERLDQMDIAIGSDPAIHFSPLLWKK